MFIIIVFIYFVLPCIVYTKYDHDVAFHYFEISYKFHLVHSPAYGYPLSLANTDTCQSPVQRLLALSVEQK